jgi:hypothetical protein
VADRTIVRSGEMPADWGLLAPGRDGSLRVLAQAPPLTPEPMPRPMLVAHMRAVAKTARRSPMEVTT